MYSRSNNSNPGWLQACLASCVGYMSTLFPHMGWYLWVPGPGPFVQPSTHMGNKYKHEAGIWNIILFISFVTLPTDWTNE